MGRRAHDDDPKVQLNVRIPQSLAEDIRVKLSDPIQNKTHYGSMSELITTLLYAWVRTDKKINDV